MLLSICIPTLCRISLIETLKSLEQQSRQQSYDIEIIICDDSMDGMPDDLASQIGHFQFVTSIQSNSGNIAVARNACLGAAKGDYIVFIDDDQTACENWLDEIVKALLADETDCLFSTIVPVYRPDAPVWLVTLEPIFPIEIKTGVKKGTIVGRTGNSVVRRAFIQKHKIRFDPMYASHGEDIHFFAQCKKHRAKMRLATTPVVFEQVREELHQLSLVLAILYNRGYAYADIRWKSEGFTLIGGCKFVAWSCSKIFVSLLITPISAIGGKSWMVKHLFRIGLELGKLRRFFAPAKASI